MVRIAWPSFDLLRAGLVDLQEHRPANPLQLRTSKYASYHLLAQSLIRVVTDRKPLA